MPVINLLSFRGQRPKIAPRLLTNEFATVAKNCEFPIGYLQPYQSPDDTIDPISPTVRTIYRYEDKIWLNWESDVNVVLSPVDGDPWGRVYYTGERSAASGKLQPPKMLINKNIPANGDVSGAYELGIPAGNTGVTARVIDPNPLPENETPEDDETRFYLFTFVSEQGEEGAPSPASQQIDLKYPSSQVEISFPPAPQLAGNITQRRLYRTASGGGAADWYLVAEVDISADKYTDNLSADQLGMPLTSDQYEKPDPNMEHLTLMPNGIVAGAWKNNVAFCEPYLPHAWNSQYRLTTEHEIVAMACVSNVLVVGTKGYPWIFQGVAPDAMSGRKLDSKQACVSKRSMLNVDNLIIYASPMGLVGFTGQDVALLTKEIIDTSFWESLEPETIAAYYYDSKYLAFYGKNQDKAFVFDPVVGDLTFFDIGSDCGYTDLRTNTLYIRGESKTKIAKWKQGNDLDMTWRSKEYFALSPTFNTLYIVADDPALVGARVLVDGQVIHDYNIGTLKNKPIRVPPKRGEVWQLELYGKGCIKQACLATSVAEVWAQ